MASPLRMTSTGHRRCSERVRRAQAWDTPIGVARGSSQGGVGPACHESAEGSAHTFRTWPGALDPSSAVATAVSEALSTTIRLVVLLRRRCTPGPVIGGVGRATFYAATSRPPADWSAGGQNAVLTRAEAFRTRWRRVPSPANQGDVRLVRGGDEQRPVGDFAPLARILVRF